MLNYLNYFNLSITLDDECGNKLFVTNSCLEITGNIKKVTKLLIDYYLKTYDIKSNEYQSHYLNCNLYVENFELYCDINNIHKDFDKLSKEFSKQIKKYILL